MYNIKLNFIFKIQIILLLKMLSSFDKIRLNKIRNKVNHEWCEKFIDFINTHSDYPLSWFEISKMNPNVNMEVIEKYKNKNWAWYWLSRNSGITLDMIENNLDKDWHWDQISLNPNTTMKFIEKYIDKDWDWKYISNDSSITWDIIENHPDIPWDWKYISKNRYCCKQ